MHGEGRWSEKIAKRGSNSKEGDWWEGNNMRKGIIIRRRILISY